MSSDPSGDRSGVRNALAAVLARLEAQPRSLGELLAVVPDVICEAVGVVHENCLGNHAEGNFDGDALAEFIAGLQAALARGVLREQWSTAAQCLPQDAPESDEFHLQRYALTRRELEVLELMAQGCTNATIAKRLVIADGTAKKHVARVLRKLGVTNRSEAVALWFLTRGRVARSATPE